MCHISKLHAEILCIVLFLHLAAAQRLFSSRDKRCKSLTLHLSVLRTSQPVHDQWFTTHPWYHPQRVGGSVCVRICVCVYGPAFSCERRVGPPPVWTAGGVHYLPSLRRPVSRASVWGTCKLPSLEYLFTKQMFLSGAITFGLHFPIAHWYRWMCIQRRPTLCIGPLGANHLSFPECTVGEPATVWSATEQPKLNLNSAVVIGGSGGDISHDGHTVMERRACISFSPPRLFLCIRAREKKGRGMEWRNHACFCPPLSVMNNLAVQGPRCRVEMVVMGRLDIYGMARSNGLR